MNRVTPMPVPEPTSQDHPYEALSDVQRVLHEELQKRDRSLAQMYLGAIRVLKDTGNPERVRQAAYSMRELMDNLTKHFGIYRDPLPALFKKLDEAEASWERALNESICYADGAWKGKIDSSLSSFLQKAQELLSLHSSRLSGKGASSQLIRKIDEFDAFFSESLHRRNLRIWSKAYGFFNGVLHHNEEVEQRKFENRLKDTELLLLDLFLPKPTKDFDSLDALIREGEDDAHQ